MATLATNAKIDAMRAIVNRIDGGSTSDSSGTYSLTDGTQAGSIAFLDASSTVLGSASLQTGWSFTVSTTDGSATLNGTPLSVNITQSGTITQAKLRDPSDNDVITMTVTQTGGGGEITLASTQVNNGDVINITSLQLQFS